MRILQVRFKNLNSLLGEWIIDFTHPTYASDGIFVITGPTGAGKTTLLDAICLGLYGETPRLRSISKTGNEIMSRQAGECFAEVTFETEQGRYRCHWAQHRARRKPDGELQLVKHEISNADSGQLLETKLTETRRQIQRLTGLAFEQFTRSVLLAQGGFAAFLQAKADERSPLLEQITGTDIYSAISQKVHQRWSEENKRLTQIQTELSGVALLGEVEEQELQAEQTTLQEQTVALAERCRTIQTQLDWRRKITELEQQTSQLEQQWQDFLTQEQAQASQFRQLQRANKALPLIVAYQELQQLRREQKKDQQTLAVLQERIDQQQKILVQAQNAAASTALSVQEAQCAQQREKPMLKQVRELDKEISSLCKDQHTLQARTQEVQEQLDRQQNQIAQQAKTLAEQEQTLAASAAYLTEHACDASLLENLSGLEQSFATWTALTQQFDERQQTRQAIEKTLAAVRQSCVERGRDVTQRRQCLEQSERQEQDLRQQIQVTLEGQRVSIWRAELDALKTRLQSVLDASGLQQSLLSGQRTIAALAARVEILNQKQQTLSEQIRMLSGEREQTQKELEGLQEKIFLLQRIRDLEQERAYLQDGQPCTVCGALEHPYAHGNIPPLAPAEAESKTLKSRFHKLNQQLEVLRSQAAACGSELKHIEQDLADRRAQQAADQQTFADVGRKLGLSTETEFQTEQTRLQQTIAQTAARLERLEQLELQAKTEREQLSEQRTRLHEAEKHYMTVQQQAERALQQHQHCTLDSERIQQQKEQLRRRLSDELAQYGLEFNIAAKVRQQLQQRRDRWREQQNLSRDLASRINASRADMQAQTVLLRKIRDDSQSLQNKQAELEQQVEQRAHDRAALYADKNPDAEEQGLEDRLAQAQQALQDAQERHRQAQHELDISQREQARLSSAVQQRAGLVQKKQDAFSQRLQAQGFGDEDDYGEALLDDAQKHDLEQQLAALQRRRTALETRRQDLAQALQAERAKALSEQTAETLQAEWSEYSNASQLAQQQLGAVQERLTYNARQRARQQERIQRRQAQQQECERWQKLYQLIGSADGKKYRNFAQGLTFEVMVAQANRQLLKMTDRYLLTRDKDKPLELNVMDQYQGGDVRSTKNLSGGESFIVSLALALGLAQMASRNVRVDSLFLDEGFGTLDEDALDAALNALASLRQEGKLIGLVSHVAALKERIGTQIQLIPESGGRSRLQGPGCRRGSGA